MTISHAARIGGAVSAACLGLSACVTPVAGPSGVYAKPIGTAPVTANPSPYSAALICLGDYARTHKLGAPRIAVGRISDYTGKSEADGSGRKVTQGASLMAMTALAKAGMPMVERFDTSIAELDLKYSNSKLISDGPRGPGPGPTESRKIYEGQMAGVDFYLVGGITELNYNIRSVGTDTFIGDRDPDDGKGIVNAKLYVMNVGLDLRLIDTRTLEVVDVISYQKQIIGREVGIGYFQFFDDITLDLGVGGRSQEPIQLAVRSVIERAVVEMMSNIYGVPNAGGCVGVDPMGSISTTGAFVPRSEATANNGEARENPNAWNERRDGGLRGRN